MISSAGLSRAQLRRQLRELRRQLPAYQQRQAAAALRRRLAQHPALRRARHIALYLPADGEIDPRPLLRQAQRQGRHTSLPVLRRWPRQRMDFQRVLPGEPLRRNRFGLAEPAPRAARQRAAWTLDLILLPLVGFDARGGRIGMGGGFYDRSLAYRNRCKNWHKPTIIGLAHACQQVDQLPLSSWDVRLDAVVTPHRWYPAQR